MSLVRLRIEIEREVRDRLAAEGLETDRVMGLQQSLRQLQALGVATAGTDAFLAVSRALNDAAHGIEVAVDDVRRAEEVGAAFLAELRAEGKTQRPPAAAGARAPSPRYGADEESTHLGCQDWPYPRRMGRPLVGCYASDRCL